MNVIEIKYMNENNAYLSAILDLADKSIISFVIEHFSNNALVFKTFDIAHRAYPDAKSIFHYNSGFQILLKHLKRNLMIQE